MEVSINKRLCMTPLDTLLRELFKIAPSLLILYDAKNDKTCVYNAENMISEAENLSRAIILAWLYYFKGETTDERHN